MKAAFVRIVVLAVACLYSFADDPPSDAANEVANMARNPGFDTLAENTDEEVASQWTVWSTKTRRARLSTMAFLSGAHSIEFAAQKDKDACDCVIQEHDVVSGKTYAFSVNLRNSGTAPIAGGAYGLLGIEWMDESGMEIKREASPRWGAALSRLRWTAYRVSGTAPNDAVRAKFVITFSDGDPPGTGQCYADDAIISEK